ncbi:MAG TPA: hypothetical protein VNH65_03265 [Candidatus Acidoferrum sp.]|nr:hypothetical protein [Candidatus Acidoferrum sp.]
MPKSHRLKTQKHSLPVMVPLNFLLGCSQQSLDTYELARLAESADLRKQFHAIFDRLIEQSALAILAHWFKESDRNSINQALAIEEDPVTWAKRQIKERQRSGDDELLPLPSLPPGAAHLAAALRYAERNIVEGKCSVCPQPLDRNSIRYCTKHLTAARHSHEKKGSAAPGSREYLYSEERQPSTHGRQPGTLAALAMNREKATRKVLAELGIPPESAAVSLNAAKESLLAHMPDSWRRALPTAALFKAAMIPSRTTGQNAIRELLSEGKIQRTGDGSMKDVFRYFAIAAEKPKPAISGKEKNKLLLQTLRGEEPSGEI